MRFNNRSAVIDSIGIDSMENTHDYFDIGRKGENRDVSAAFFLNRTLEDRAGSITRLV